MSFNSEANFAGKEYIDAALGWKINIKCEHITRCVDPGTVIEISHLTT